MASVIPKEIALKFCEEIRQKNRRKRFGFRKMQCYFCWRFGKKQYNEGDPSKLCIFAKEDLRGCGQVNKAYDKQPIQQRRSN
ncbi:MAG: hypothetical protein ACXACI_09070 [Candidatus Hodarchaeales archaeon]